MNFCNLVFCDADEGYSQSFIAYMTKGNNKNIQFYYCDNEKGLSEIARIKQITYLFISERILPEVRKKIESDYTFVLTEEVNTLLNEGEVPVFKYQKIDEILSIFYRETKKEGKFLVERGKGKDYKEVKLLGVYSPGDKKTSFKYGQHLAKQLAKNTNVLYITTQVHVQEIGTLVQQDKNILDLIYYYRQEHKNLRVYLKEIIKSLEGFDYIEPSGFLEDIKEVPTKDWMGVLALLLEESYYENIVIEISEIIKGAYCILSLCNEIHLPILADEYDYSSINQFERELQKLNYTEILKRIQRKEVKM
ncbi:MAG TPA: hypothetical protein H9887_05525 [Candidatus Dorea intestinavium]|nr:hypothetical protein [Candidatus Dorea intestinavium]